MLRKIVSIFGFSFLFASSAFADQACIDLYKSLSAWIAASEYNYVDIEVTTMKQDAVYTGWGEGRWNKVGPLPTVSGPEFDHIYSTRTYGSENFPFNPNSKDKVKVTLFSNGSLAYILNHVNGGVQNYGIGDTHCSDGFIYGVGTFQNGKHMVTISYKKRADVPVI